VSQENVDAFLVVMQAINGGDVEGVLGALDEDCVLLPLRSAVEGGFHEHDGVRALFADNAETFEVFQLDWRDVRDLGGQVLAIGTVHHRGRGGGVEIDTPTAGVASFRDGKLTRWEDYGDRGAALKAVGLEE
jgi:ketosteroid isomerase-like protein